MEITAIKENKLKAILMFSVPSIIAMLLQTTITITDGYFTGNYVGENALAAHFFSWLGVSMYLDRSAIESLLQNIASISANGSYLLFDYADAGLFHSEERRVQNMLAMAKAGGEEMKSSFDQMSLDSMLSEHGFMICEHLNCKEIHDRFFSGRTDGLSAFEHINYAHAVLRK